MVTTTGGVPDSGFHREKIYPFDGMGAVVVCGNETWGSSVVVIPIDGIFDEYGMEASGALRAYKIVGFNIISKASPTVQCTIQIFRVNKSTAQVLDVDSGLGETPADRIYVPLTGDFAVDDWVWVVDDDTPAGEISQIDAIVTDDYLDMDGDLAALYSTAQNAKVYLVHRATSPENKCIWTPFSAASTKEMQSPRLHGPRQVSAGDGLIARGRSVEAGTPEVYLLITYDDG